MSANQPLTEEEVKQLVLTFWKLQEEKAHLVDLMEVTAPDLEISMGEFAWTPAWAASCARAASSSIGEIRTIPRAGRPSAGSGTVRTSCSTR